MLNEGVELSRNFITEAIDEDLASGRFNKIITRFPPEPNGYLHIGHAKALCIDFSMAERYNGVCNLRYDDTNPAKEEVEYVDAIEEDIRWLGFNWAGKYYASDYFKQMYDYAVELIKKGKAYVCSLSADEITQTRGTLTTPGVECEERNRSVEENLELFERMKNGEFPDGSMTLRAKIDMASPNMNMRDPVMYRIKHVEHHHVGDEWCIYPMYDWAHGLEDSIEGVSHSMCSLEYEDHRPLYDWFLNELNIYHPRQIEFARLNINYVVLSKRKLIQLVKEGYVRGWDDPRMPTLRGLRRRGYTPTAVKNFINMVGVSKVNSVVDYAMLEHALRDEANKKALRVMAVLDPIKLVIDNYPEGKFEYLEADNNPEDENAGKREVPFSRELYIEREDFMAVPEKKFFRLAPGREVRLKHAYYVTCTGYETDENGNVTVVHCNYDPASRGGWSEDGRKVKATLHWVSAQHALEAEVRLYGRLFTVENPDSAEGSFLDYLNKDSLEIIEKAYVEPSLADAKQGVSYQFLRLGYFCLDDDAVKENRLVFNRSVALKDSK
ncbi:MAG: glutamine--tRNA ligase/YqeY domain fusion protein [Clostridiales bacterium]|nr:glutamine--tRNA ligase/YqeY domain fusion protein [Clostridiales bacterium]